MHAGLCYSFDPFRVFQGMPMRPIKQVRRLIKNDPASATAQAFSDLILALESEAASPIKGL